VYLRVKVVVHTNEPREDEKKREKDGKKKEKDRYETIGKGNRNWTIGVVQIEKETIILSGFMRTRRFRAVRK